MKRHTLMFFTGIHHPFHARHVRRAFVSVHALRRRIRGFAVGDWIMDSGAFSTIEREGGYSEPPRIYAAHVRHWSHNGNMMAAVSQDWMCEAFMLARTGKSVAEHQHLTIERYDALLSCGLAGAYLLPVLQGYIPDEYRRHLEAYGDRLPPGAWVGVGSLCKRNTKPTMVLNVLRGILADRPDLRLHGFGLKATALADADVQDALFSADSMAWSLAARFQGGGQNDWRNAVAFENRIGTMLNGADRVSGVEGVAGPAVTGPAHSESAAYSEELDAHAYRNHAHNAVLGAVCGYGTPFRSHHTPGAQVE